MPSVRIQLSNHRAILERRFSGGCEDSRGSGALGELWGAPKSCMYRTLAGGGAGRNSDCPPPGTPPPPDPDPQVGERLDVTDARSETRALSFALDSDPHG